MAKIKPSPSGVLFGFDSAETMPRVYYSGDKPNANLRTFVEEHRTADLTPPALSGGKLEAEVETRRGSHFFSLHKYWSKKGHEAIQHYVSHFSKPGDLLLDPFCGSGGLPAVASQLGRHAIAIDLSPAATLISAGYCTPVDPQAILAALAQIRRKLEAVVADAYSTECGVCKSRAEILNIDYSAVFQCLKCLKWTPYALWNEGDIRIFRGREAATLVCPHCGEPINTQRCKRRGFAPYYEKYFCPRCRSQKERGHVNGKWIDRDRLESDAGHTTPVISDWAAHAPAVPLDGIVEPRLVKNVAKAGVRTVADLYDIKAAAVLSAIRGAIETIECDEGVRLQLKIALSGILWTTSTQNRVGQAAVLEATYYVPHNSHHINVWRSFEKKGELVAQANMERQLGSGDVIISTQSSADLSEVPSSSVDYVFTDPPYGSKFQYGQLNLVWEAWLGLDRSWYDRELVVADHRSRDWDAWAQVFKASFSELYRVLKPGRYLTLCYHDSDTSTWALVQDLMAECGFMPVDDRILAIDGHQKTYNQSTGEAVTKRDLVINYRKPAVSELPLSMEDDDRTFHSKVKGVLSEFLTAHPGSTKDRIYDELVGRMVRRGQLEPHDFDAVLRSVAEEVRQPVRETLFENREPDLFGSHVICRWYLKLTADQIDRAEQEKEDAAANRLEKFMVEHLAANPEEEGVHFSNLFEQVILIPVSDKPRRTFDNWLPEYFFKTTDGTWRPPADEQERQQKAALREAGTLRRMKRFANALIDGVPIRDQDRPPNDRTLAEWIRQCRRAGLYEQGRALYEKGGLNLENLGDEEQIAVEDDYRICVKRKGEDRAKPKRQRRKKGADE